jgi:hypothetical protein
MARSSSNHSGCSSLAASWLSDPKVPAPEFYEHDQPRLRLKSDQRADWQKSKLPA